MKFRIAMGAAIVVALVTACSDQATDPSDSRGYRTTSELKLLNRSTGQLERVAPEQMAAGVNASVVAATNSKPAIVYLTTDAGVPPIATYSVADYNDGKHVMREVTFYKASTPPSASYAIVDGKLVGTTVNTWTKISNGWYLSKSVISTLAPSGATTGTYTTLGQYTQTTVPCNSHTTSNCPPAQMVLSPSQRVVRTLASVLTATSCRLSAQGGLCLSQWAYVAAAWIGTVAGTITAETGAGAALAAGSYIGLGAASYDLAVCRRGKAPNGHSGGGSGPSQGPGDSCDTGGPCLTIWTV